TEVLAKCAATASTGYSLECPTLPLGGAVAPAGETLLVALIALASALVRLKRALDAKVAREGDELDPDQRRRIETLGRGLLRRVESQLTPWQAMLRGLGEAPPEDFVEWFGIERVEGQEHDLGYYRHWIDPTRPFAEAVLAPAEGALITSATLTDGSGDPERDWAAAEARCGTPHLQSFATRARVPSPFDYGAQTRALVVTDVGRNDGEAIARAYGDLFLAAGGGALGLFTAITRLRSVQARLAPRLEAAGLTLYAQHVDELDPATLIEILRAEDKACLLGTDALRDGIDVPGRALRLLVFDRVPWPRPDLRHKARRARFGGRDYEERLTRLKLKQAFGRLIRRADDRGVFVLLDRALPSRLAGAFPDGVAPRRLTLDEAVEETRRFLAESPPAAT
ncbi:MAG: helicase C-terminal domain-containing protein, partial [Burkholderiales bacterium]